MKLSEAKAIYIPKSETTTPRNNRQIKTYLKKTIRAKTEVLLGMEWKRIQYNYNPEFLIQGSPKGGAATLILRSGNTCTGFGGVRRPKIELGFRQMDLFEPENSN